MYSAIGMHCADNYNDANVQLIRNARAALNPDWINIMRGQNPDQALAIADEIAKNSPTQVFIRHRFGALGQGDEKTVQTFPNPLDYFRYVVSLYKPYDLTLVVGNEQTLPAYDQKVIAYTEGNVTSHISFVHWNIQEMRYMHDANIRGGFFRFPSWHPYRDQFSQFDETVTTYDANGENPYVVYGVRHAFQLWPEMVLTPNWYYTQDNFDAIIKGIEWWEYLGKPNISIGEFGILFGVSFARQGWKSLGWDEERAANNLIDVWKTYLKPHGIPVSFFNFLKWHESDKFEFTEKGIAVLAGRKNEMQIERMKEVPMGSGIQVRATDNNILLRTAPVNGTPIGDTDKGEVAELVTADDKAKVGKEGQWLQIISGGKTGYSAAWYFELVDGGTPSDPCDGMVTLDWHNEQIATLKAEHQRALLAQAEEFTGQIEAMREKITETLQDILNMIAL